MKDIFAEIELDFEDEDSKSAAIHAKPVSIDPIREKIFEMRSMALSNPNAWHDAKLFYRQGKFVEELTDGQEAIMDLAVYSPTYQRLSLDHLRTYFTWRTAARRGEFLPISLSYIFLYVYELLSNIGVASPAQGLTQLMTVWNTYRVQYAGLDKYLPLWLKDYHVYYPLSHSFKEFVSEHNLHNHYFQTLLFEPDTKYSMEHWNEISSHDILKSKFYSKGNQDFIHGAFYAALDGVRKFCEGEKQQRLEDLLYRYTNDTWIPFRMAIFYPWLVQDGRNVDMPLGEHYYCGGRAWKARKAHMPFIYPQIIGYILKKTESYCREMKNHKPKLRKFGLMHYKLAESLMYQGVRELDLNHFIQTAIDEWHRQETAVVVNISRTNLTRIREESQDTTEKLIVEEEPPVAKPVSIPPPVSPPAEIPEPVSESSPWAKLINALTEAEGQIIALSLASKLAEIKILLAEAHIMPEIIADSINEKAMDTVGDNILEEADTFEIYQDYKPDLLNALKE